MNAGLGLIIGYLIGGIPTGILICRAVGGVDPRTLGSGSSGATNVSRIVGKKWAVVVLVMDAVKGFLPVLVLAPLLAPPEKTAFTQVGMALGAVIGHVWTPYAHFRGGKGIATAAGAILAMDALAFAVCLGIWISLFALFRRVSLASLGGAIALPGAAVVLKNRPPEWIAASILLTLILVFTHRENIQRLLTGREKPIA